MKDFDDLSDVVKVFSLSYIFEIKIDLQKLNEKEKKIIFISLESGVLRRLIAKYILDVDNRYLTLSKDTFL
ncbi:MAG: hypothetical protein ACTSUT_15270 [Promethearchaeota archaeon]